MTTVVLTATLRVANLIAWVRTLWHKVLDDVSMRDLSSLHAVDKSLA